MLRKKYVSMGGVTIRNLFKKYGRRRVNLRKKSLTMLHSQITKHSRSPIFEFCPYAVLLHENHLNSIEILVLKAKTRKFLLIWLTDKKDQ